MLAGDQYQGPLSSLAISTERGVRALAIVVVSLLSAGMIVREAQPLLRGLYAILLFFLVYYIISVGVVRRRRAVNRE